MNRSNLDDSLLSVGSCMLCEKNVRFKDFPKIINKALSRKYCSNLNQFFYTKDINKILSKQRSRLLLYLKEWVMQDFSQECLKRSYKPYEFPEKIFRLWKYYGKVVDKPKVIILGFDNILVRYYRFQQLLKNKKKKYIFEDDSSSKSSEEQEELKEEDKNLSNTI